MGDTYAITGLIAKRAEISARIEHLQGEVRQLLTDLDHIDATILIFDPSIELEQIRNRTVPPRHHAFRGEVTRIVLAALKEATAPMTTEQIAQHVMAERGLDRSDKRLVQMMLRCAGACLRMWRQRGLVARTASTGRRSAWILTRRTTLAP